MLVLPVEDPTKQRHSTYHSLQDISISSKLIVEYLSDLFNDSLSIQKDYLKLII